MQTWKSVLKSRNISLLEREQETEAVHLEMHFQMKNVSKLSSETFYEIKFI